MSGGLAKSLLSAAASGTLAVARLVASGKTRRQAASRQLSLPRQHIAVVGWLGAGRKWRSCYQRASYDTNQKHQGGCRRLINQRRSGTAISGAVIAFLRE